MREWRAKDPEKARAACRKSYQKHVVAILAHHQDVHPLRYDDDERAAALIRAQNRKARKKGAEGVYTRNDIAALEVAQRGHCAYCAMPYGRYHVEHRQPLILGGTNWPDNLCLSCPRCNLRKGTKTEAAFRAYLLKYGI